MRHPAARVQFLVLVEVSGLFKDEPNIGSFVDPTLLRWQNSQHGC
jgi:hypothetical protein